MLQFYKMDEIFMELWNQIPEVVTYKMYRLLIEQIKNDYESNLIDKTQAEVLIAALYTYIVTRGIKKEET